MASPEMPPPIMTQSYLLFIVRLLALHEKTDGYRIDRRTCRGGHDLVESPTRFAREDLCCKQDTGLALTWSDAELGVALERLQVGIAFVDGVFDLLHGDVLTPAGNRLLVFFRHVVTPTLMLRTCSQRAG